MKLAFFGSPEIAANILQELHRAYTVSLVVTKPDRPAGRGRNYIPTAVSAYAKNSGIDIVYDLDRAAERLGTQDIAVVAAYGEIIPKSLLTLPAQGFINIHYSLLPAYRGASPVSWALLNGDHETGVSILQMDEELDHGPLLAQSTVAIRENDTALSLQKTLTVKALPLLLNTLGSISHTPKDQDHTRATYTRRLTKHDGFVEYHLLKKVLTSKKLNASQLPALQKEVFESTGRTANPNEAASMMHNFIRALHPWPGAWTLLSDGTRCKINRSTLTADRLTIEEIQLAGKAVTTHPDRIRSALGA